MRKTSLEIINLMFKIKLYALLHPQQKLYHRKYVDLSALSGCILTCNSH